MSSVKLKWSKESYGLKEFAESFRGRLPVMVKVTQGYCGIDEAKYTFSMEEVRKHNLSAQTGSVFLCRPNRQVKKIVCIMLIIDFNENVSLPSEEQTAKCE